MMKMRDEVSAMSGSQRKAADTRPVSACRMLRYLTSWARNTTGFPHPVDDNNDASVDMSFIRIPALSLLRSGSWLASPGLRSFSQSAVMRNHCAAVTKPAPDFKGTAVVDNKFKTVKLEDYQGKYLILFFYPLDFTFVCPTEIIAFSDRSDEFRKLNTELVAVSVDSHYSHLAWNNQPRKAGGLGQLKIPLLSDLSKKIAQDYGVLLEDPGIALRGLFLIDPKGIVRHITINDLPVGRSVDEVLRLVNAFQFVEKHGEVCPANWEPNKPSINPKKASDYFEKNN